MKIKFFILAMLIMFLTSCNEGDKNDGISKVNIFKEKLKQKFLYKTEVYNRNNSVFVKVIEPPLYEIYYETRLMILRQKIVLILNETTTSCDSLFISFAFKEVKGDTDLVCFTKTARDIFCSKYSTNIAFKSFYDYLYLNMNGEKVKIFSSYFKVLKKFYPKSINTFDYIQHVYNYLDEYQGKGKHQHTKEMLQELKNFLLETKDWKEFNEEDINYFLHYKF